MRWIMVYGSIAENLAAIRDRVSRAAKRAGRRMDEIRIVGVSKTQPAGVIRDAYEAGLRHFGENRVQEWEAKRAGLEGLNTTGATWHLIGHLQSNKAARAAKLFDCVDAVDDFAVAERLNRARDAAESPGKLRVLIEVRAAPEETKSGVEEQELAALAEKVVALPRVELAGLMCIPPFFDKAAEARPHFAKLRELRDELAVRLGRRLPELSMGMSHDFEVAIEEGATEVRVGTALFGERPRDGQP
ncbi:MAG: YggS family pyridoxal phosphate-dependent enzyme [Candidatus Acidiferrum sp.]